MRSKALSLGLSHVAILVFGLAIGYTLKHSVDVKVYDPDSLGSPPPSVGPYHRLPKDLAEYPIVASAFEESKHWRPLVKVGPFDLYYNPKTSGYMIINGDDHQPILLQETAGDKTKLSLWGKRGEIVIDLIYDRASGRRVLSNFDCNGEGGFLGPTKWSYRDNDGDGHFDNMVDCGEGIAYEQEGLQWVEIGRRPPDVSDKAQ